MMPTSKSNGPTFFRLRAADARGINSVRFVKTENLNLRYLAVYGVRQPGGLQHGHKYKTP